MVSTKPTSAAGASLATKGRKAICQSLPILVFPGCRWVATLATWGHGY
jgi:hypothetical protein